MLRRGKHEPPELTEYPTRAAIFAYLRKVVELNRVVGGIAYVAVYKKGPDGITPVVTRAMKDGSPTRFFGIEDAQIAGVKRAVELGAKTAAVRHIEINRDLGKADVAGDTVAGMVPIEEYWLTVPRQTRSRRFIPVGSDPEMILE